MEKNFESMDEEKMKELMIEYIDGNLKGELKDFVVKYIQKNDKNRKVYEELQTVMELMKKSAVLEPESVLKEEFNKILEEAKQEISVKSKKPDAQIIPITGFWTLNNFLKIAAGIAILIIGYFIGIQNRGASNEELEALRREMEATKKLVIMSLEQESASQRIMGVNVSNEIKQADNEILDALIKTMNEDENVNVRLAAVNALVNFSDHDKVKNAFISGLLSQKEPIVQIALINIMVNLHEEKAVEKLQQLVNDVETLQTVKDEAQFGLFKLM